MLCRTLSKFSKAPICHFYLRFLARIRMLRSAPTSILASLIPRPLFHGRCHGHTAGEGPLSKMPFLDPRFFASAAFAQNDTSAVCFLSVIPSAGEGPRIFFFDSHF